MNYERGLLTFLILLLIICCLISTKTQARKDLELITEFSTVREMCKEVNKKEENA